MDLKSLVRLALEHDLAAQRFDARRHALEPEPPFELGAVDAAAVVGQQEGDLVTLFLELEVECRSIPVPQAVGDPLL